MRSFWSLVLLYLVLTACTLSEFPSDVTPANTPVSAATTIATLAPTMIPTRAATVAPTAITTPAALNGESAVELAHAFDGQAALEYVRYLTSQDLAGRKAGTPGADKAAEFMAEKFRAAGLKPVGDNGTYFQNLSYAFIDIAIPPTLAILNPDNSIKQAFKLRVDFRESGAWMASNGQAEGEVVFLGRGTNSDFDQAGDLKNKIALVFQPPNTRVTDWISSLWNRGLAGALVITNNPDSVQFKSSYIVGTARAGETHPLMVVTRAVAEQMLAGSGETLQALEDRLNRNGSAFAPTRNRVRMALQLDLREAQTKNVVGAIPGSDPNLANEVVIVGGHYDHVGDDPGGLRFEGANDNASGAAVVTALAEFFARNKIQPKRTLLFAAWTAEESGLVGSQYYVDHPLFPLAQTKGYLNLDVVGAGGGDGLNVTNDSRGLSDLVKASAQDLNVRTGREAIGGGSDHESFLRKGVPAVFLIWQRIGDIHMPSDTFDKIDVHKLKATGQVAALTMIRLAEQ